MSHTKRKRSVILLFHKHCTVILAFQDEINLRTAAAFPVFQIPFQGNLKRFKSLNRIVEVRNRLMQSGCRIIAKLFQEMAKTAAGLIELLRLLHQLVALRIRDKVVASPRLPFTVLKIVGSALCLDIGKRLPVRISAFLADHISQVFGYTENIFHDTGRILEYIAVDSLKNIGKLIPIFTRCINRICLVDMACAKRLHIAASRSKTKRIDRILQITIVHTVNLPVGREDHISSLYLLFDSDITVCLYHTVQADMSTLCHMGIMIDYRTTVDQNSVFDDCMRINHCLLHDKCTISNDSALAYKGCRMNDRRHLVSCFHQLFRPEKPHIIVTKSCYRCVILFKKTLIIAALSDNVLVLYRIIQKYNVLIA